MTFVSRLALAAAFSLAATTAVSPALAQKKGDKQAAPQVSGEFRKVAQQVEPLMTAKNFAAADPIVTQAESVAKSDEERYYAASWRLTIEANRNSNEGIAKALDVLLANPKTPQADLGKYNFFRGKAAADLKRPAEAIPFLEKARTMGYDNSDTAIMLASAYVDTNRPNDGLAQIAHAVELEKAAGRKPPESWYKFAFAKVYNAGDRAAAADWIARQIKDYPTAANFRLAIVNFRNSADRGGAKMSKRQQIDLFRLMRATNTLADQSDYYDYAVYAVDSGLPNEAIAVIDEGRAAGKVPQGNADFAAIYATAKKGAAADVAPEALAKQGLSGADGKIAAQAGDVFFASGNYARAAELYQAALQKGGVDTSLLNLRLGEALARAGRKDEARAAFGQVQVAPTADIAKLWILTLDVPITA